MSALMISTIEVTDPQSFASYLQKSKQLASRYGAELLFRGTQTDSLNGDSPSGPMIVIARFPDIDSIKAWNNSQEYKDLIPLRDAGSHQVMTAYTEAT